MVASTLLHEPHHKPAHRCIVLGCEGQHIGWAGRAVPICSRHHLAVRTVTVILRPFRRLGHSQVDAVRAMHAPAPGQTRRLLWMAEQARRSGLGDEDLLRIVQAVWTGEVPR